MGRNKGITMKEITVLNELKVLSPSKANQIEAAFKPMVETLKDMEAAYDMVMSQEISKPLCKKAKRLRLDIAKIRVAADKVRESEKKQYTIGANAIQGMYNILKFGTSEKEDKLKNIETHYEQIEAERKRQCEDDRQSELSLYYETVGHQQNLSDKSDQEWKEYIIQVAKWDKERLDKIEAARKEQEEKAEKEAKEREERIREDERKKITAEKLLKSMKAEVPDFSKASGYKTKIAIGEPVLEILDSEAVERIADIDPKSHDNVHLGNTEWYLTQALEDSKTEIAKKAISQCLDILSEARGWL